MTQFFQLTATGLTVGMVYGLIALGFALVWKSSGVANLALGELVLICSWFTYGMMVQAGLPLWLALIAVVIFALALGWTIERLVLRPLIAQPILSLITASLGVAYFLRGLVTFVWPWSVDALPRMFPPEPLRIGGVVVSQEHLWAAGISLVLFGLLTAFFRYHRMGLAMRATAEDQLAAQACGIRVSSIFSLSWMFASVVAAAGGVLMSSIGGITFGLVEAGLKSFSVVILGGLESFGGALIAGPIIGLVENLGGGYLTPYVWAGLKDIVPFVVIIIVLFIKPYGIFGEQRIERI
ncbi:MAG: branched-chain amino acid ABC transporter permease [Chloroflexi bacterium]|nr:branched-chain amino acid ABC transporter permease [Chloroflexota bacterium]